MVYKFLFDQLDPVTSSATFKFCWYELSTFVAIIFSSSRAYAEQYGNPGYPPLGTWLVLKPNCGGSWWGLLDGCIARPILDKKQESVFRKAAGDWITRLGETDPEINLPRNAASILLSPGGHKMYPGPALSG